MAGCVALTALMDEILVLRSPGTGLRFLGQGEEKSVKLAARRLSRRVLRRLKGLVEEPLEESSSLLLVVCGDSGRGGDVPVQVEPQVGRQEVRCFVGGQRRF